MDHRQLDCWLHMLPGERYRWTTEGLLAGCTCYLAKGIDGPQRAGLLAAHVTWRKVQMDHRQLDCWLHMLPGERYRWTTEGWLAGCTCYCRLLFALGSPLDTGGRANSSTLLKHGYLPPPPHTPHALTGWLAYIVRNVFPNNYSQFIQHACCTYASNIDSMSKRKVHTFSLV